MQLYLITYTSLWHTISFFHHSLYTKLCIFCVYSLPNDIIYSNILYIINLIQQLRIWNIVVFCYSFHTKNFIKCECWRIKLLYIKVINVFMCKKELHFGVIYFNLNLVSLKKNIERGSNYDFICFLKISSRYDIHISYYI